MKTTLKTLLLASALMLPIAAYAGHQEHNHGNHQHEATQHEEAVMGSGVVHSVSRMNNKINLTHAPIPALNWPEMTMDLDVAEGVDLQGLSSGQKIKFHIELGEDKIYRITKIMKEDGNHGNHAH
jgi:Cu(I)/Ag(I) efflux system protein CusF